MIFKLRGARRGGRLPVKTLYLHVGTTKTGTTALQYFCYANRDELGRRGLGYPVMPFRADTAPEARNGHALVCRDALDADGAPLGGASGVERCLDEVESAFADHDAVLLSDEDIWVASLYGDCAFWGPLLEHAREHAYAVKIVIYLRRQDSLANSWYLQLCKEPFRKDTLFFDEWIRQPVPRFDYRRVLDGFSSIVGADNIIVRVYDRARLEADGGSIYSDFLGCMGLALDDGLPIPEGHANDTSLTPNFAAFLHAAKNSPYWRPIMSNTFRNVATRLSKRESDVPAMQMFSADEARAFVARFAQGNASIASEWLGGGPLFSDEYREALKWTSGNEWMEGELTRFFQGVSDRLNRQLELPGGERRVSPVPPIGALEREEISSEPALAAARHLADYFLLREIEIESGADLEPLDRPCVRRMVKLMLHGA